MLDGFGLSPFFTAIIGGDTLPVKKPDKGVIDHILSVCRKPAGKTLMIGDSATDILAGKNGEVKTVAVTYGIGDIQEIQKAQPDFIIDKFPDLIHIVNRS